MITTGDKLILHGNQTQDEIMYEVGRFCFEIGDSGSYVATVEMISPVDGIFKHPMWAILDLLKSGDLYPPVHKEMMTRLHEQRKLRNEVGRAKV